MKTFAQIIGGQAINIVMGDDVDSALAKAFADDFVKKQIALGNYWISVPDGTQPGAKDNGDGTFTNPTAPPPPPKTSKQQILDQLAVLTGLVNNLP